MEELVAINAFLEEMGDANDGVNHGSDYHLVALPDASSLERALEAHFSAIHTSRTTPRPAAEWQIRNVAVERRARLTDAARTWFFGQEFSPPRTETEQAASVEDFLGLMHDCVGDATAHVVTVRPPTFYECDWEDLALESDEGRWLLHFGFAD